LRKAARAVPAPSEFGTEIIGIPEGTELELDLRLEAVMEGVLVSGTVRGRAAGECIRCLDEVQLAVNASLTELFAYPDRVVEDEDVEDDVHELVGDLLDLESVLRNAVVLALPFQPVCRDDCPGLCSECGARLADDPDHRHEAADPRWSALQGILTDGMPHGTSSGGPHDEKES
jgi:uncharacterized protein